MIRKYIEKYLISRKSFNEFEAKYQNITMDLLQALNQVKTELDVLKHSVHQETLIRNNFSDHYIPWREKRVTEIIRHFSPLWFRGKKILELGCGYGEVGKNFEGLGAVVTYCDARQEHLDVILKHRPHCKVVKADINNEWPFEEKFDLIVHMGVLYHLDNMSFSIAKAMESAYHIVLETEVCDSNDPMFNLAVEENILGYDQSVTGLGSRPSVAYVERLVDVGKPKSMTRLRSSACDSNFHQYSWEITDTKRWEHGLRSMWFIDC
ncbi:class I SAM-dependent methyltransferase [Vibrio mimicus]